MQAIIFAFPNVPATHDALSHSSDHEGPRQNPQTTFYNSQNSLTVQLSLRMAHYLELTGE